MNVPRNMSFSLTKDFQELWPEFVKLVDRSPRFQSMVAKQRNKDGQRSKTFRKGKDSARVRFAVVVCMKDLIAERAELDRKKAEEQPHDEIN